MDCPYIWRRVKLDGVQTKTESTPSERIDVAEAIQQMYEANDEC